LIQPEEKDSKIIIALDGNFQLRRMKNAGSNIGERIISESFIVNQNQYDEWAQSSINISSSSSVNKGYVGIYALYLTNMYYIN
jgi:hypothetical protein